MQAISLTLVFILSLALMGQAQSVEESKKGLFAEQSSLATATEKQSYKESAKFFISKDCNQTAPIRTEW